MKYKKYQNQIADADLKMQFITLMECTTAEFRSRINFSYKKDVEKYVYYLKVWIATESNVSELENIHLRGKGLCLDHIIPITLGYKYNVDPQIIGCVENLQLITPIANLLKASQLTDRAKELLLKFNIELVKYDRTINRRVEIEPEIEGWRLSSYPKGNNT